MPDHKLTSSQTAAVLVLMAEAREISNPELEKLYGITITGADRTRLNDLKLVESRKRGRAFVHVLTDSGWAYAAALFREGIEASQRPAGRVLEAALRAIVANLRRSMDRTGQSIADVFARDDDLISADPAADAAGSATPTAALPSPTEPYGTPHASGDVETRIRKAYAQLATEPNAWVSLARLRPLLGDAPRAEVDATLRRMIGMPDVRIVPWENQKTLTQADHDAAVVIGDEPKHMILIGA